MRDMFEKVTKFLYAYCYSTFFLPRNNHFPMIPVYSISDATDDLASSTLSYCDFKNYDINTSAFSIL